MRFFYGWCLVAALAAGCGESSGPGDDAGGAADAGGMNDGSTRPDGGLVREQCGAALCDLGQVCCNESCGICTLPGEGCTAVECLPDGGADAGPVECNGTTCVPGEICCPTCGGGSSCTDEPTCPDLVCAGCEAGGVPCDAAEYCDYADDACGGTGVCTERPGICTADCPGVCGCDGNDYCNACNAAGSGIDIASSGPCAVTSSCDPMDAATDGVCGVVVGYAWDGRACQAISCACAGTECDALYSTVEDCAAAHTRCGGSGSFCGGFTGTACDSATEYCDYPDDAICGFADGSGFCRTMPTDCDGEPRVSVCGCNGTTYANACEANLVGVDVQSRGACET